MTNRPALSLLLAGCVGFGAITVVELVPSNDEDAALLKAPPQANIAPVADRKQNPRVEGLLETARARPLFSSTRRPPQNATDARAADIDFSEKRLTGIVTTPGHHFAIFAVTDGKPLTLSEGESVSGWRIDTIEPIEVSLSGPGGNKTLRPKPDPTLAQPPGTMPAGDGARQAAVPPNIPGSPRPRQPRVEPRR